MELNTLISGVSPVSGVSDGPPRIIDARAGIEVTSVTHDSRAVGAGSLFACLRGEHTDGHDHVAAAVAAGATALLVDHEVSAAVARSVPQMVVGDTRVALGPISATVYGHPSRALTTVGITGTNGKTTTAQLIASIFEGNGMRTGIIGTLQGPRTTPEAPELQSTLADFVAAGSSAAVLEVSSHALALHRVDGTEFDGVVFTNLGRDHLDLHGSTEEYFRAKARLFDGTFATLAIINVDDIHGRLLADTVAGSGIVRVVEVSINNVSNIEVTGTSHSYRWNDLEVRVPLGGRFNVSNSLVALVTAVELGVEPSVALVGLAGAASVPGRFESVATPADVGFTVIVDYAHTPDGLTEVLASARAVADAGADIVVVFGAGGERDHDKRPEMGRVAELLADHVIVTSDNPRHEDPMAIIGDILSGMNGATNGTDARVTVEPDRRAAIEAALAVAPPGGVVVIAGKGHENTQDLGSSTIEFDDRVVAREILGERS